MAAHCTKLRIGLTKNDQNVIKEITQVMEKETKKTFKK